MCRFESITYRCPCCKAVLLPPTARLMDCQQWYRRREPCPERLAGRIPVVWVEREEFLCDGCDVRFRWVRVWTGFFRGAGRLFEFLGG
jgi:hypothetical protein